MAPNLLVWQSLTLGHSKKILTGNLGSICPTSITNQMGDSSSIKKQTKKEIGDNLSAPF